MEAILENAAARPPDAGGADYARLRRIVRERTGLDLEPYKGRFLERRLAIRLRATRHDRLGEYVDFLDRDRAEVDRLMHCLTIHVSTFFRNPSTYEAVRELVLPALFAPGPHRTRRVWSVGCSRGEEPYTLALLVLEHLGAARRGWDVRIHGIDVDDRVLEEAKAGVYPAAALEGVDAALRERWFIRDAGRWRVGLALRRMVRFHRRDVLMEPPGEQGYDLVVCRNLLIYLGREAQGEVLERFARALRPGGFLVLGRTEIVVGPGRSAFEVVDARERIYRRVPAAPPPGRGEGGGQCGPSSRSAS